MVSINPAAELDIIRRAYVQLAGTVRVIPTPKGEERFPAPVLLLGPNWVTNGNRLSRLIGYNDMG
jgi:hypothetical protein